MKRIAITFLILFLYCPGAFSQEVTAPGLEIENTFEEEQTFPGVIIEWSSAVTYQANTIVSYMDQLYSSVAGGNINRVPTLTMYWTPVSSSGGASPAGADGDVQTKSGSGFAGGTQLSSLFNQGSKTISAVSAATAGGHTLYMDADTVPDGVTINGSTTITSATANFTPDMVGLTFTGIDGNGVADPGTTTIATYVNATTITVVFPGTVNTGGVRIVWGNDDTLAWEDATEAYLTALETAPVCLMMPAGISIVGHGNLLGPGTEVGFIHEKFPGCLKSFGQTVIFMRTDFDWGTGSMIQFASTGTLGTFALTYTSSFIDGLYIWGGGIRSGSGSCDPVDPQQIVFWGQSEIRNSGVNGICDGTANITGMTLDNGAQYWNIVCANVGDICGHVQGSNTLSAGGLYGSWFQESYGGWPIVISSSANSFNSKYVGFSSNVNGDVKVEGSGTVFRSFSDAYWPTRGSNLNVDNSAKVWITGAYMEGLAGWNIIDTNSGTEVHVRDSQLVGGAGAYVYDTTTGSGGTIIDEGGNVITGPSRGSGVVYSNFVDLQVVPGATNLSTGDGKFYFDIPAYLNGKILAQVSGQFINAGTTGTTDIQLARCAIVATGNACSGTVVDMLSTKLTVDSTENKSSTAAAAAVINVANDDVATDQVIRVDIDAVSTTAPQGFKLKLSFQ